MYGLVSRVKLKSMAESGVVTMPAPTRRIAFEDKDGLAMTTLRRFLLVFFG
jgi:hypothetical protein